MAPRSESDSAEQRPSVVVMGVAGSGKTTIGQLLAKALDAEFFDGDDFHPAENVAKMAAGNPLTDEDRYGWLTSLQLLLDEAFAAKRRIVVAC